MTSPDLTDSPPRGAADGHSQEPGVRRRCITCGLSVPAGRIYCTTVCRSLQNRYARASARVPELTAVAMESEELERPEFAAKEWVLVQAAVERLAVMTDRIRNARLAAGLSVSDEWP